MMRLIAINGSPRKEWNTATLLKKALEGAASQGAETEMVHLYDLDFKGCKSCFACRLKGGKSYGKCAQQDGITPVLERIEDADALVLGSPIYMGMITGEMKSFFERATYPYLTYESPQASLFPKRMPAGFIYTMGTCESHVADLQIDRHIMVNQWIMNMIFGPAESLIVTDTYQFDDYAKYVNAHDAEGKAKRRIEIFPQDCRKAFDMGVRFARK